MPMFLRISKAILLAVLMYLSLRYLGISRATSFAISLIPSVLGAFNIMAGLAYSMTGLVFMMACGSTLMHELKINMTTVAEAIAPFLKKLGVLA